MGENSNHNVPLEEMRQGEVLTISNGLEQGANKFLYLESYGCQMNFSDSEVVAAILSDHGFSKHLFYT